MTTHDPFDLFFSKPKIFQNLTQEGPIDSIISFGYVKLDKHSFHFGGFHGMNSLYCNNHPIQNLSTRKTPLLLQNKKAKSRLKSLSNQLSNNFVSHIAQGYRPKEILIIQSSFWNKSKECSAFMSFNISLFL